MRDKQIKKVLSKGCYIQPPEASVLVVVTFNNQEYLSIRDYLNNTVQYIKISRAMKRKGFDTSLFRNVERFHL